MNLKTKLAASLLLLGAIIAWTYYKTHSSQVLIHGFIFGIEILLISSILIQASVFTMGKERALGLIPMMLTMNTIIAIISTFLGNYRAALGSVIFLLIANIIRVFIQVRTIALIKKLCSRFDIFTQEEKDFLCKHIYIVDHKAPYNFVGKGEFSKNRMVMKVTDCNAIVRESMMKKITLWESVSNLFPETDTRLTLLPYIHTMMSFVTEWSILKKKDSTLYAKDIKVDREIVKQRFKHEEAKTFFEKRWGLRFAF